MQPGGVCTDCPLRSLLYLIIFETHSHDNLRVSLMCVIRLSHSSPDSVSSSGSTPPPGELPD
jgi:hypothetical protein